MKKSAKSTSDAPMFECTICCKEAKESSKFHKLQCPSCQYIVCSSCQKTYGKIDCMNCHMVFRNNFAIEHLGKVFVTKTVKENKLKELMLIQNEELKTIQPLVDWTKRMRIIEKQSRYGVKLTVSNEDDENDELVKPTRGYAVDSFPCLVESCRGRIYRVAGDDQKSGICGLCKKAGCMICQEALHTGECSKEAIETINNIRQTTKPCPKCATMIHKTHGCDHMHCTVCNTHFSWQNGTIMHNSSNYHYRDALIRARNASNIDEECRISDDDPRIPEDVFSERVDSIKRHYSPASSILTWFTGGTDSSKHMGDATKSKLDIMMDGLYNVPKAVRSLVRNEYSMNKISENTRNKYDELQVKYVLNEITGKSWEQGVYKSYVKQLVSELISNILYIYLGNMDGFQSEFYSYPYEEHTLAEFETFLDDLMNRIDALIDIANDSISEIRMDYEPTSSNQIMIRKLGETQKSYCSKQGIKKGEKSEFQVPENRPDMSLTPIIPYDYQLPHIAKLEKILLTSHFAIDLSPLGTGKTYSAGKIFQNNQHYKHILTISPLSVKTKWAEVEEKYGMKLVANLTYNVMAGRRGVNPTHGLLIRNDYKVEVVDEYGHTRMLDKYVFTPTSYLNQLIEEGLLLVIDEFQHLKNESAQTDACQTIITRIMDHFNKVQIQNPNNEYESIPVDGIPQSRVLLMSGSPIDRPEQAARLFRTLGIMRNPRIVSGHLHAGINEVIEYLQTKFHNNAYLEGTVRTVSNYVPGRGYVQNADSSKFYMYRWFLQVLKPNVTSTMDASFVTKSMFKLSKYNGYFVTNNAYFQEKINSAVRMLEEVARNMTNARISIRRHGGGTQHQEIMRQITLRMMEIETAKIHTFHVLAKKYLSEEGSNKKVVIALNYSDSVAELESLLSEYNPLILTGSKTFRQRKQILNAFQAPNNEHRLLIGNFTVMSTGIDLDDKHGGFPRVCLASPNCSTISIYQLGHRFLRGRETKSDSQIFMVYSGSRSERKITELLMRKGAVMKEVLSEQVSQGMVFPCDYTTHEETLEEIPPEQLAVHPQNMEPQTEDDLENGSTRSAILRRRRFLRLQRQNRMNQLDNAYATAIQNLETRQEQNIRQETQQNPLNFETDEDSENESTHSQSDISLSSAD